MIVAKCSVNTLPVLPDAALMMSQTASARKMTISNVPRIVPVLALSLTPRKLSTAMSSAPTIMTMTQVVVNGQFASVCMTDANR